MNVLEAMDSPELFGPFFEGASWTAWRAFLAALVAAPLTDDQLALYTRHTGRLEAPKEPFTEAALICGRRGGKSRMLALLGTCIATLRDYRAFLAPGEVATVAILASDRKQARSIFRYVKGLIDAVPSLKREVTKETDELLELGKRQVAIEITTASFRATRGYTYAAVLCDEVAFWRSEESANPDEEILAAIRPGLANIPGALLLLASSPYAKRGALYKTFRRHHGKDGARVLVWKASTKEMNPGIDPAIIAEAYEDDPANAAAEYGAEFRNDIAAFVAREVVEACTPPGRFELPYVSGRRYVAFCDLSGAGKDSMTLAIGHEEDGTAVLDAIREIRPPCSPEGVVADFTALLKSYYLSKMSGDKYAGEWPREQFRKLGIQYELAEKSKADIYREFLPALNSRKVELLDDKRLASQLCNLERRTARGGKDSIDHPPGGHDDIANAVAGALLMAGTHKPMVISPEFMARLRAMPPVRGSIGDYRRRGCA